MKKLIERLPVLIPLLGLYFLTACGVEFEAKPGDPPISTGSSVYELLEMQSDSNDALNIVFLPDDSYGSMSNLTNRQAFLDDLEEIIEDGYWENEAYYYNLGSFNYYYMDVSGTAAAPTGGSICPTVTWPSEVNTDAAFADLILLIHTNTLRDCRWGNKATSEPTSFRTVVHESNHALFNLPDEYCCDGGYKNFPPVMYTSQSACTSDPDNAAWQNCVSFVSSASSTSGNTYWRSEGDYSANEIMISGGSTVWEMGPGDWVVMEDVLDAVNSLSANSPDVVAPDNWTNPNTP